MAFQSGQNCQQFSWSKPVPISRSKTYFYGQNSHFCYVQTYKFSCQITKYLGRKFLGQSPLHSNAKISCSTLFHSNFVLNSVPFQQHFMLNPIPFQFCAQLRSIPTVFLLTFGIVWAFTGNSYSTSPTM